MRLIVRQLAKEDYKSYRKLFDEAYHEYLENLSRNDPQQYHRERQEKRIVTRARFNFYLKTGSSFAAEKDDNVVGYVAAQTISFMRGHDRALWVEYIVIKKDQRRQGIATALLEKLKDCAKQNRIDTIYATINPDNIASIKLHQKLGFDVRSWKVASLKVALEKLRHIEKRGCGFS